MGHTSEILTQIELAARDASAPMLRMLIRQAGDTIAADPVASGEYGQILLLKLDHLLTQQQAIAAQHRGAGLAYLAPHLVVQESKRAAA